MANSITMFRGQGFRQKDALLEVWLRLLCLNLGEEAYHDGCLREVRDEWLNASSGWNGGWAGSSARLDELLNTQDRIDLVIEASEQTLAILRDFDRFLPRAMLNALGFIGVSFGSDLEVWKVVQLGEHFVQMLRGQLETGPRPRKYLPYGDGPPTAPKD